MKQKKTKVQKGPRTIYLDQRSGHDENYGDKTGPLKTIELALAKAKPKDTIQVHGEYVTTESIVIDKDGICLKGGPFNVQHPGPAIIIKNPDGSKRILP